MLLLSWTYSVLICSLLWCGSTSVWYSVFTQSCFPNKKTDSWWRVKQFIYTCKNVQCFLPCRRELREHVKQDDLSAEYERLKNCKIIIIDKGFKLGHCEQWLIHFQVRCLSNLFGLISSSQSASNKALCELNMENYIDIFEGRPI